MEQRHGGRVPERRRHESTVLAAAEDAPRAATDGGHLRLPGTHHNLVGLPLLRRLPHQVVRHERGKLAPPRQHLRHCHAGGRGASTHGPRAHAAAPERY